MACSFSQKDTPVALPAWRSARAMNPLKPSCPWGSGRTCCQRFRNASSIWSADTSNVLARANVSLLLPPATPSGLTLTHTGMMPPTEAWRISQSSGSSDDYSGSRALGGVLLLRAMHKLGIEPVFGTRPIVALSVRPSAVQLLFLPVADGWQLRSCIIAGYKAPSRR